MTSNPLHNQTHGPMTHSNALHALNATRGFVDELGATALEYHGNWTNLLNDWSDTVADACDEVDWRNAEVALTEVLRDQGYDTPAQKEIDRWMKRHGSSK